MISPWLDMFVVGAQSRELQLRHEQGAHLCGVVQGLKDQCVLQCPGPLGGGRPWTAGEPGLKAGVRILICKETRKKSIGFSQGCVEEL